MRNKIGIWISLLLLLCCSSRISLESISDDSDIPQKRPVNIVSFKVNGQTVITSGWSISRFVFPSNPDEQWLNITTNMNTEKRTITVNLNGVKRGTYLLEQTNSSAKQSHGSFYPDYTGDLTNSYSFIRGSFTITDLDTIKRTVNAYFHGAVRNSKGDILSITDGRIENGVVY